MVYDSCLYRKALYFRHSPPKMHQTHVCLSASHSSVLTLLNPTHIDRHTIRLSIMREFASKTCFQQKSGKWGSRMELRKWGKTELLVCFVLHSCCVLFSFFRIDASWTFKSSIIFVRLDYCTFGPLWPVPRQNWTFQNKIEQLFHTMSLYHRTWAKNVISCHIIASHR